MIYRCRVCQHKEGRGFLPGVTCGLLLFGQMGIVGGIMAYLIPKGFIAGLGSWWWIAIPVLPVAAFFGAAILHSMLEAIEWLAYCRRRCPRCDSRRWSWGITEGFGL